MSNDSGISAANVIRLAVGGAIGGLITFFMVNPGMRAVEMQGGDGESEALYLGAVVGAAIGGMLILAQEIAAPKLLRIARKLVLGTIVGALIGTIGVFCADMVYSPLARTRILPIVIVGRVAGWAVMGAAAGLCPGIVDGSKIRIRQGAMGGIAGGALGGLLFDTLGMLTGGGGSVSRFVGFVITGLAIGIAVGLIEEMGKVYWLTAITGSAEGRSYILAKPTTILGRNELTDIPVFGDPSVSSHHASIHVGPAGAIVAAMPGAHIAVNGAGLADAHLQDGDVIEIGRRRFRFHQRVGTPVAALPPDGRTGAPTAYPYPTHGGPAPAPSFGPQVAVVQGPHAGAMFALTQGAIIGRDPRCDIPLVGDVMLSRQHARFILEADQWIVEDGNSTNGVYVNGVRISRHVLAPRDLISAGQSVLQVSY